MRTRLVLLVLGALGAMTQHLQAQGGGSDPDPSPSEPAAPASEPTWSPVATSEPAGASPSTPARDESLQNDLPLIPGVRTDNSKPHIYLGVQLGHIWSKLYNDNHERGPSENGGWLYGLNFRGELINMVSGYGGRFGAAADFDFFLVSGGVIDGPQQPRASWAYIGFTPSLLLGVAETKSFSLAAELGAPITTDFYGLSLGGVMRWGGFYLGYRFRSGHAWRDTEVLDERVRIGLSLSEGGLRNARSFLGLEIIDGYSEDDMGRADLGTLYRGSYTHVGLVYAKGY